MPSRYPALRHVALLTLASALSTIASPAAEAQTTNAPVSKLACVQASDKAQQLRVAGKLLAAREALHTCIQDGCPGVVREACSQWLGEVQASLPSIVIGAKDSDGKDLLDLKVSIDGTLVTEHLGGLAVPIDPGRHKMRYEKADGAVLEEEILVGEGSKNRGVSVVFPGPGTAAGVTALPVGASTAQGPKTASSFNTAMGSGFALVGAGVLGTALYLDLSATSDINALKASNCAPNCSKTRVAADELDYDLAGVGVGLGIVAVGVAVYVFVAHPFGTRAAAANADRVGGPSFRVVASPHGSGFALTF
jgi:hypothetical protein